MYQGLEVGELSKLTLNLGGKVTGEMIVDSSFVPMMRENMRIELRNPKLPLSDVNISSLLTRKTFELVPGDGEPHSGFVVVQSKEALLHEAIITYSRYLNGLSIVGSTRSRLT